MQISVHLNRPAHSLGRHLFAELIDALHLQLLLAPHSHHKPRQHQVNITDEYFLVESFSVQNFHIEHPAGPPVEQGAADELVVAVAQGLVRRQLQAAEQGAIGLHDELQNLLVARQADVEGGSPARIQRYLLEIFVTLVDLKQPIEIH